GIRDKLVTGVQTCALPISEAGVGCVFAGESGWASVWTGFDGPVGRNAGAAMTIQGRQESRPSKFVDEWRRRKCAAFDLHGNSTEIGRASCRERGEISGGGG